MRCLTSFALLTHNAKAANCGEIVGLFINGIVSERFGYKRTVLACLVVLAGLIAIPITANSVEALCAYYFLAGTVSLPLLAIAH